MNPLTKSLPRFSRRDILKSSALTLFPLTNPLANHALT